MASPGGGGWSEQPGGGAIRVEVAAAVPARQERVELVVPAGTTVAGAVRASGILARFPELPEGSVDFAVYGVRVAADHVIGAGDRVELLRALRMDPRESRRRRARKSG